MTHHLVPLHTLPKEERVRIAKRLMRKVEFRQDGCWIWNGYRHHTGYGAMHGGLNKSSPRRTHRVSYELFVGPIPEGLVIDHLCRVRECCNPLHLEPVTHHENVVLRADPTSIPVINAAKTHCKHGHELAGDNIVVDGLHRRVCLTCRRARDRQRYARKIARAVI